MTMTETESSFDELEAQMDEIEAAGVPAEWEASVKKLRKELASKREKFGPLAEAFDGLHAEDQAAFINLASALKTDPTQAARMFVDASKAIAETTETDWNELAGITAEPSEEPAEPVAEETAVEKSIEEQIKEAVAAALGERDEQTQLQRITDKLEALGYTDPSSAEAQLVLLRAKQIPDATDPLDALQKAHEGLNDFIVERSKSLVSPEPADAGTELPSDEGSPAVETSPADDGSIPELSDMRAAMNERLGTIFDNSRLGDAAV